MIASEVFTLADEEAVRILRARVPDEEWGEAWLMMRACVAKFEPAPHRVFELYFIQKWTWYKIDRLRRQLGRVRGERSAYTCRAKRPGRLTDVAARLIGDRRRSGEGVESLELREEAAAAQARALRSLSSAQMDTLHAVASGMTLRQEAAFRDVPEPSVKTERNRSMYALRQCVVSGAKRKEARAAAFARQVGTPGGAA